MSFKIAERVSELTQQGQKFFSYEFFVPKTNVGEVNLYRRVQKLNRLKPLFCDVTWGAGGSTKDKTLEIVTKLQDSLGMVSQMHMTLTGLSKADLIAKVAEAKTAGIRNLLLLRGDPPRGIESGSQDWIPVAEDSDLLYARDFVKLVRQLHGDYFSIAVAGYPEGHPNGSYQADLNYLKEKIEAGADMVITQFFYNSEKFLKFVRDAREIGIPESVPILPGVMMIVNYSNWMRMVNYCKVEIPQWMKDQLDGLDKDSNEVIRDFGVSAVTRICTELLEGGVKGFHFYTLNLSRSVTSILSAIRYIGESKQTSADFPWLRSASAKRQGEKIRPIFWSNRPESYVNRTTDWDEMPIGPEFFRGSPAYGNFHSIDLTATDSVDVRKTQWGEEHFDDSSVFQVFVKFLRGEIASLPWCEKKVATETSIISDDLLNLNRRGFLTINSQPSSNGVLSDDPIHGWGKPGGYIYKKAYLEFFCSPANLEKLLVEIKRFPSLCFHAVNHGGSVTHTNTPRGSVTTVTWAVFPSSEILQPTCVDDYSFMSWSGEAFDLWNGWKRIYEEGSASYDLIQRIHDSYFLVNIVDNDYVGGDIFKVFREMEE